MKEGIRITIEIDCAYDGWESFVPMKAVREMIKRIDRMDEFPKKAKTGKGVVRASFDWVEEGE